MAFMYDKNLAYSLIEIHIDAEEIYKTLIEDVPLLSATLAEIKKDLKHN